MLNEFSKIVDVSERYISIIDTADFSLQELETLENTAIALHNSAEKFLNTIRDAKKELKTENLTAKVVTMASDPDTLNNWEEFIKDFSRMLTHELSKVDGEVVRLIKGIDSINGFIGIDADLYAFSFEMPKPVIKLRKAKSFKDIDKNVIEIEFCKGMFEEVVHG